MVSFLNKWLFITVLPVLCFSWPINQTGNRFVISCQKNNVYHPFHVSVVEINHNAADKTLEISCKIFTDDFEKVLAQNYKTKVDLINPPNKAAMDSLVKKYVLSHFSIMADGKPAPLVYLGFERESEAVYSYIEVDNIAAVRKIDITNSLMHDMFTDQVNLMHVKVGDTRKSTKLDYPATVTKFEF